MGCGCWRLLSVVCPLLLHFVMTQEPMSMVGKCDTIYKGFAGCLISLGDSMVQSVQRQQESGQEVQELDSICKSWDDFHACASGVLSSCPEEAAAIWESLREESRKIQFQGNLHELCSTRAHVASARGLPAAETNQETLRGSAAPVLLSLLPLLVLPLLVPWV